MLSLTLLVCTSLGQNLQEGPMDLVPKLGARRYAEREAASGRLEELGPRALYALQTAKELRDPEIRTRAVTLIDKIEGSLLTKPTLVKFDLKDATIAEAAASLSEQTGVKFVLLPDKSPRWQTGRVTIQEPTPLPFWQAMDRFCDAARVQFNLNVQANRVGNEPTMQLFEGGARPSLPTSDSGPFRVSVLNLHYQRDVTFPPKVPQMPAVRGGQPQAGIPGSAGTGQRTGPDVSEQFFAQIQIAGEPRLVMSQTSALRITEAADDKAQSLTARPGPGGNFGRFNGFYGGNSGNLLQQQVVMSRPESPGKVIRKLKGNIPVVVSTRRKEVLSIKLEGSAGKEFKGADAVITVHQISTVTNARQTIELSVRSKEGSERPFGGLIDPQTGQRPDLIQLHFDVLDANGQPMNWFPNVDVESGRVSIQTFAAQDPNSKVGPSEIRYYGLAKAATEIAFEFNDLPLP